MRRYIYLFISLFAIGGIGFLFFNLTNSTEANKHEFWITIDQHELEVVKTELTDFSFETKKNQNGIALVHINNGDLERLSAAMHKHFNKCAGFASHQNEAEANRFLSNDLVSTGNQKFVDYTIDNAANVNQLLPNTQEIRVRQMILDLSSYPNRRHNQPSGEQSAQYIKNTWESLANGREDMSVAYFIHPGNVTPQPSVILTITGTVSPDEIVVLGGHQDSIRTGSSTADAPGADDDASGIASLTETIRVISETNFKPEKTVKFMAYAAEEVGLRGSNDIASDFSSNNQNVIGVLQLDMTNYNANSTDIDFAFESDSRFINVPQTDFIKQLIDTYLPSMNYTNSQCNYGCSDHASWHNQGFPASFPFEAPFGQHNNAIHTGNDTIERSGGMAVQAEKFTKLALTFVGELAKGEIPTVQPEGKTRFDFDGDQKTDVSVFRQDLGQWWLLNSSDGGNSAFQFGQSTDQPVPADYTGDGKTDIAFWRNSTDLFILRSEDSTFYGYPFGSSGDIPAPGDFDGDGIDDFAVFRPAQTAWFINRSSDGQTETINFGASEDQPTIADFDGDGKDDIAIFRPSLSQWWQLRSTDGIIAYQFGTTGDKAVPGDYTGDGRADVALWRESTGQWLILRSEDSSFYGFPFGSAGDIPTPGDYDGDGTFDAVVFRPTNNVWYKQQTTNGFEAVGFGVDGDLPLPNTYVVE